MTTSGFGLAHVKQEGMCYDHLYCIEWHGHTDQMEKQYAAKYSKWYYWPIRNIIRKAFVTAWHNALKEEAKRVSPCTRLLNKGL